MFAPPHTSRSNRNRTYLNVALASWVFALVGTVCRPATAQTMDSATFEVLYEARARQARERTSESEMRFMRAMLAHHLEGMELLELAVNKAETRGLRTLAMRMRSNYESDIAAIAQWLRDREPSLASVISRSTPSVEHQGVFTESPGMLTPRQVANLRQATGRSFETSFLTISIQHHFAARQTLDSLMASGRAAVDEVVSRIVDNLLSEQNAYVGQMRRMLNEALRSREQD